MIRLRRIEAKDLPHRGQPVDPNTLRVAAQIVEEVRREGEPALRRHAERLGDIEAGSPFLLGRSELEQAWESIDPAHREVLGRVEGRIRRFATAQREGLTDLDIDVLGGRAGHTWGPVGSVGAYAPGGRYPLPSSVLMTAVPARVAGVPQVWVASPRPSPLTLAAAAVAGADGLLCVGGAQAVAALAFGTVGPACDLIVGPGNRWVTAAKKHLYGEVGIDGLAGPSEIVVIADKSADPGLAAADLLAQAEHDTDAVPILVTTSADVAEAVNVQIAVQLADLPTSATAGTAIKGGFAVVVDSLAEAAQVADRLAPEHLALHVSDPDELAAQLHWYGSLFLGKNTAEAFADYGVGPNHVLPTDGGAKYWSGLSVFTFLRSSTWTRLDDPASLVEDTVMLARMEGLEAHARAALRRNPSFPNIDSAP